MPGKKSQQGHAQAAPTDEEATSHQISDFRGSVRGLANLGNTCFFNSTLQCLASLSAVHHNFALRDLKGGEGRLLIEFRDFVQTMLLTDGSKTVNPAALHGAIVQKQSRFKGFRQQDAHELLQTLRGCIDDEEIARMKRKVFAVQALTRVEVIPPAVTSEALRDALPIPPPLPLIPSPPLVLPPSVVQRTFGGRTLSLVVCSACGYASAQSEPSLDVSVEVSWLVDRFLNHRSLRLSLSYLLSFLVS
jgi:ubiquitin carboxyl-terminal hydrolase 16/45